MDRRPATAFRSTMKFIDDFDNQENNYFTKQMIKAFDRRPDQFNRKIRTFSKDLYNTEKIQPKVSKDIVFAKPTVKRH